MKTAAAPWVLCITVEVHPGREAEYLELVSEVIDHMRHEPTFINTFLSRDRADPCRFFIYETWVDREDFYAHRRDAPYKKKCQSRLAELLRTPMVTAEWDTIRSDLKVFT